MRKKLVALMSAGLLLTGCGATTAAEPTTTPAVEPTQASEWEGVTFCNAFENERENYQEAMDGDAVNVSELASYREWADALKDTAPTQVAEDVAAFTAPIYMTESGPVDLIGLFAAGNSLGQHCALNG